MASANAPRASAVLDAALASWETYGRPGMPDNGYALSRLDGRTRQGIYRVGDGTAVFEPEGHILRMTPSPDGNRIAVELADRADEDAALGVVDARTGALQLFPDTRCRYDPVLWHEDSARLELVASKSRRLVLLDTVTGERRESSTPPGIRRRLFPGGARGLLAESHPGKPTSLTDRATGTLLGTFAGIIRVLPLGEDVLVEESSGLHALHVAGGAAKWRWEDPSIRLTEVAAYGESVLAAGVRAGRSVIVRIVDGVAGPVRPVTYGDDPAVASGVSADAGEFRVRIEGPVLPPRVVEAEAVLDDRPTLPAHRPVARTRSHTVTVDDGVDVTVIVTSPPDADGPTPLILTCYGGFGVPSLPVFEPTIPAWIEQGGRYAIAQIRGGGEHGSSWREAGRGALKPRGIADLTAVARGLIDAGLTTPDLVVLAGASHGGVIVTSCALGSPQLCAGVVATAAPLDLLNLDAHPLGHLWIREFGDPDTDAGSRILRSISPVHRAESLSPDTRLPDFLGIVLDEDSRVAAVDTGRLVAALRRAGGHADLWNAPRTGHGGNHVDSLHQLGSAILGFAENAVETRPASQPTGREAL